MIITRTSILTNVERTKDLDITEEQWKLWNSNNRPLIQYCFPQLSADDREFIMTGITDDEWNESFPEPEE